MSQSTSASISPPSAQRFAAFLRREHCIWTASPSVALLAGLPGVTVVPCALWDSRRRFGPVHVKFGPPLDLVAEGTRSRRERNEIVVDRMMSAIAGLLVEIKTDGLKR